LVNQAIAALLRGHNTTISIAHRLSTIKRSDRIVVIGGDGTITEQGSFAELSNNPNGAFTQLMRWQMSGEMESSKPTPRPTEEEVIEHDLESPEEDDPEEESSRKSDEKEPK
jgi:putative ABC transport system ATP-binding protein